MTAQSRFQLLFALWYGAIGILGNFFALYLKSIGISGAQIGFLAGVIPFASVLVGPVWAYFADVTQNIRALLAAACLGLAISMLVVIHLRGFGVLLSCMLVVGVFHAPIAPFCDSLALQYLDGTLRQQDFGKVRMWGSIGFAVSVFFTGALVIEHWINSLLYLYTAVVASIAIVTVTLPESRLLRVMGRPVSLDVLRFTPKLYRLLLGMILIGATLGAVNQYMIIYLDELHTAGWLSGLIFAAGALCEVPLMARTTFVLQKLGSRLVFLLGVGLLPIRWCLYIFIKDPFLLIPIQLIHSIAMLSLLVVGVMLVDNLLPPQWRTTGQTMYTVALHGLGAGVGVLSAGLIYNSYGMSAVWAACLITGSVGFLVLRFAIQAEQSPSDRPRLWERI